MKKFPLQTLEIFAFFFLISACGKSGAKSSSSPSSNDSSLGIVVDANREISDAPGAQLPQDTSDVSLEVFAERKENKIVGVRYSTANAAGRGFLERASKLLMPGSNLSDVSASVKEFISYVAKIEADNEIAKHDLSDGIETVAELRQKEADYRAALKLFENRKFRSSEVIREQQALIQSLKEALAARPIELKALDKEIEDINAQYNPQIDKFKSEIERLSFSTYGITDLQINTEVEKRYENGVWGVDKMTRRLGDWVAFWESDSYPATNSKKAELRAQVIKEIKEGDFVPPGVPTDANINSRIAALKSQRDKLKKEQIAKIQDVYERKTLYSYGTREPDIEDYPRDYIKYEGKYITALAAQQSISAAETLIASETPYANKDISEKNPEIAQVLALYKDPLAKLAKHVLTEQEIESQVRLKSVALGTEALRALDCVEEIQRKGLSLRSQDLGIFNLSTDKKTRIDLVLQQDFLKDTGDVAYFTLLAVNKEGFLASLSSTKAAAPKMETYDLKEYSRYSSAVWLDLRGLKNETYTLVACSHSKNGQLTSTSKRITLQAQ